MLPYRRCSRVGINFYGHGEKKCACSVHTGAFKQYARSYYIILNIFSLPKPSNLLYERGNRLTNVVSYRIFLSQKYLSSFQIALAYWIICTWTNFKRPNLQHNSHWLKTVKTVCAIWMRFSTLVKRIALTHFIRYNVFLLPSLTAYNALMLILLRLPRPITMNFGVYQIRKSWDFCKM